MAGQFVSVKQAFSLSVGSEITLRGWVRSRRDSKGITFIELNDGSRFKSMQLVVEAGAIAEEMLKQITTGSSIEAGGVLVESPAKGQAVELKVASVHVYGTADATTYPLQKKGHTLEFLREISHLRVRSNTFGAVFRVRNALTHAIHTFFQERDFLYVHTPIITTSDCEGAGQMFGVTTLNLQQPPRAADGKVDWQQDFFAKPAYLTVSGQLEGEIFASAFSKVYTFGPTFRAENSNTPRHLAEFWMIEPEMAFYELEDNMRLAEEFLKYIIRYVLEHCREDLEFFNQCIEKTVLATLEHVAESDFGHITYTEAIDELKKSGKTWEFPVEWGSDLQTEHERFLVRRGFQKAGDRHRLSEGRSRRSTCAPTTTAKPCARWTCSCRGSARSSAAASAKSATMFCCSGCAMRDWTKNLTGGISTCAATAPFPTPASASAWSA